MKDSSQPISLYETKWVLAKLHTTEGAVEVTKGKAFIKFDAEKGQAGGNGSCNRFGGSFFVIGDSLAITQVFSTKMYCEDVQKTEDIFLSSLSKVNRYVIKGSQLTLLHDSTALLEFSASNKETE